MALRIHNILKLYRFRLSAGQVMMMISLFGRQILPLFVHASLQITAQQHPERILEKSDRSPKRPGFYPAVWPDTVPDQRGQ